MIQSFLQISIREQLKTFKFAKTTFQNNAMRKDTVNLTFKYLTKHRELKTKRQHEQERGREILTT